MTLRQVAIVEGKYQAPFVRQLVGAYQQHFTAHPQVEQQPAAVAVHLDPFAAIGGAVQRGAGQGGAKGVHRQVEALGLDHLDRADPFAGQALVELVGQVGDFG